MQANLTQFENTDTQVIALAVQDQAAAQGSVNDTGVTYPILADPDHNVTDAYGVYNLLGDGVATPAVFVINKSGQISWSYIGQNINDRPANSTILANLPQ